MTPENLAVMVLRFVHANTIAVYMRSDSSAGSAIQVILYFS